MEGTRWAEDGFAIAGVTIVRRGDSERLPRFARNDT